MNQPSDEKISKAEAGETDYGLKDVQEQAPATKVVPSGARKRWIMAAIAVVAAGVIATAIGVPLALRTNSSPSQSVSQSVSQSGSNSSFSQSPFTLSLLTSKVLKGYLNRDEFESDLRNFSESYVNGILARNAGDKNYMLFGVGSKFVDGAGGLGPVNVPVSAKSPAASSPVGDNVNDFHTNNQVDGVDEGDQVQTNGKIAFAAYGQYIVGWSVANGTSLLKMKLDPTGTEYVQPFIQTLLLKDNLLVVVAGNYGSTVRQAQTRVLSDYLGTRISIYDISSIGKAMNKLDLLAQRDINGYFVSIRAIGNNLHLILRNQLNLYSFLAAPFERSSNTKLSALNSADYLEQVQKTASSTSIPQFAKQTADEISECGVLPNLVRLNRWTTQSLSTSTVEQYLYNQGYAQSLMTIASFDLTNVTSSTLKCASVAGVFFPADSWSVNVYSGTDTMIMAVGGYDYSSSRNSTIQSTYVVAFDLNGPSARPKSIGNFEGYVLNQFSLQVDGSILQLATTLQQQWVRIMALRPNNVSEQPEIRNVPVTENWIISANLEGKNGTIELLDKLKLGKEGERFTAVRFYKNRAYAVTFLRMDPFYVLDTTNPYKLNIAGVLDNITGWSSYLKPMNNESSVLLAIGQETNGSQTLGVSVSVFDARNLNNVNLAARTLIESNSDVWSDSEGLRNKDAIRFNAQTGVLILPLVTYRWNQQTGALLNYFRGFKVFIATLNAVMPSCIIDLSNGNDLYSYSYGSLEPRAMIIGGNAMTTMGSNVTMTNLDTCKRVWNLTIS